VAVIFLVFCAFTNTPWKDASSGPLTVPVIVAPCTVGLRRIAMVANASLRMEKMWGPLDIAEGRIAGRSHA